MPDSICGNSICDEMEITEEKIEENNINNINEEIKNNEEIIIRIKKEDLSTKEKVIRLLQKYYPEILENYEIKEPIGSGSESIVYEVINKKINRSFAMKFIIIEKEEKRNINELNISQMFKNQNIIKVYGFYEIKKGELDCIIMEYAKFGNLRDFQKKILKREILSEQLLCFFAFQILNGLKHCHKCKIAHCDLKPQNIIIDEYLFIKLIDFSVSINYRRLNSDKIRLPFRGTSFYISPEVIKRKTINVKDLNKIDLYSLGMILYYLAFGHFPYDLKNEDVKNYDTIYYKVQNNKLEFDNEGNYYSEYFIDFLKKLLEKDINKRININEALNHYWTRGGYILLDEKEKTFNASSFLINIMTDHFINFNQYINN